MVHPPAKGPPSRGKRPVDVSGPRVGFVEGTRPRFADETAGLLRTRLQAAALVVSILLFLAFAANLFANRFQDVQSLDRALAGCACAGKWTEEHSAAWWREIES